MAGRRRRDALNEPETTTEGTTYIEEQPGPEMVEEERPLQPPDPEAVQTTEAGQGTKPELLLEAIIGQFIDPTNAKAVVIAFGSYIIINETQVPKEAIDKIKAATSGRAVIITCMAHAAEHAKGVKSTKAPE